MSHLLEHMMFKGTKTRTSKQIAEEIESRGGSLNAFTDKEFTCYYARVLSEDLPIAVDVLCDMVLNSLYDPEELDREEQVILEEIKRHEDQPEDLVHDLYLQTVWEGHPLALPIIGTADSVSSIRRDDILGYIARRYTPDRILVSVAGNFDPKQLADMVQERLGSLSGHTAPMDMHDPAVRCERKWVEKDVEQVNFCYGGGAFSQFQDEKYTMAVLDTILGGSMSSRLFQEIREKRGLAYSVGSYAASYAEGGVFAIYGGTSPTNLPQVMDLVKIELDKLLQEPLPDDEVEKAKNQLRGNMLLGLEGMSNRMTRMAKNELYFERIIPLEETIEKVNAVTPQGILDVARNCYQQDRMTFTGVGPPEGQN